MLQHALQGRVQWFDIGCGGGHTPGLASDREEKHWHTNTHRHTEQKLDSDCSVHFWTFSLSSWAYELSSFHIIHPSLRALRWVWRTNKKKEKEEVIPSILHRLLHTSHVATRKGRRCAPVSSSSHALSGVIPPSLTYITIKSFCPIIVLNKPSWHDGP